MLLSITLLSLVFGSPAPLFEWTASRSGDRFGSSLACVGDVNGDGVVDWAAGAPRAQVAGQAVGRVQVMSGADGSVLHQWLGGPGASGLGADVAGVGDLDGDGHGDILVGAPQAAAGKGEARLYSGATGMLLRTWVGAVAGDQFGRALCGLGDVDGDGVGDLGVGAPASHSAGTHAGEVSVYSGRLGTLLFQVQGAAWDHLGHDLVGLGDVNGDGCGDLAIGIPFSDDAAFNGGRVQVHSGRDGGFLWGASGHTAGDQFGFALGSGADVDMDGIQDLVVVAPAADASGFDSGSASVLSGVDGHVLFVIPGPGAGVYMSAAQLLQDQDGDGRAEVLTGTPAAPKGSEHAGYVGVHSGVDGSLLRRLRGARDFGWFGFSLAAGGDLDGDGVHDFAVGAPGHDDHPEIFGSVQLLSALPF